MDILFFKNWAPLVFLLFFSAVLAISIAFCVIEYRRTGKLKRGNEARLAEYMDRTLPCPYCFGRGRIARPGWVFTDKTKEKEFEIEMAEKDIPYSIRKSMENRKDKQ